MTVPGAFFEVTGSPAEIIKIVDGIERTGGRLTSSDSASCDLWCEMYDEWFVRHDATIRAASYVKVIRHGEAATIDFGDVTLTVLGDAAKWTSNQKEDPNG